MDTDDEEAADDLKLAGVSLVAVILISFPLGVLSAVKKNKTADYIIRFLSFFGVSMPNPC